jgi:hypothetical protein
MRVLHQTPASLQFTQTKRSSIIEHFGHAMAALKQPCKLTLSRAIKRQSLHDK